MFIAILTYKKSLEEVDGFLQAHREYLAGFAELCAPHRGAIAFFKILEVLYHGVLDVH